LAKKKVRLVKNNWRQTCSSIQGSTAVFIALLLIFIVTNGCKVIWRELPASGRIVNTRSHQPITGATITQIDSNLVTNQTTSDANGRFKLPGKRGVMVLPYGNNVVYANYRIEATGYQIFTTNRAVYGPVTDDQHNFGELQLLPK
jgi:hypothetical protein